MACLEERALRDFTAGQLDVQARAAVVAHLDTCDGCQARVRAARDAAGEPSLPRFDEDPALTATAAPSSSGDLGLLVTAAPASGDLGLLATQAAEQASNGDRSRIALEETAMATDGDAGVAPTLMSGDLAATPVVPRDRRRQSAPVIQGKRIGRFTMTERLGAGAMGVVWRAEDPTLGRHVALKLLRRHDESLTERLVREARAMAQVNHPNVVTVYEVGEADDGTMFIAMELVTGRSLRAWQNQRGHSVPEIVEAYIAAARGLAAAHAAGIIHRDFKPDNVLVGDDGRVRVTDFGLAAAKPTQDLLSSTPGGEPTPRPAALGDVNLTTSGSVLGTPAYMAPEQFVGGNVDSRTDQFNFCVSLYEAVYGERPFDGKTFPELSDNVCEGRIRPEPAASRVSRALREILERGLSVKPGDRFPTMEALIAELGRDRARPWRRTAYASAAIAGALALGLVSDWIVRDRLTRDINQSFALTGTQVRNAVAQLREQFNTVSAVAYREAALREVAGHHDQADFGLGAPEDDQAELERLHNTLQSTEWVKLGSSELAIADYKGRLLFTTAAPSVWGTDLKALPPVKAALDAGKGDSVTVIPYADPALAASQLLGAQPRGAGLAVVFVRTLALGDKEAEQSEARAIYLQVEDGKRLLDSVRLDPQTRLALVAPGGAASADPGVTPALVRAALAASDVTEVDDGGRTYQVQSRAIEGLAGQGTIAHVVMARPLDGMLSLFPGARVVFALTAFGALVLSLATWLRAREITAARD